MSVLLYYFKDGDVILNTSLELITCTLK